MPLISDLELELFAGGGEDLFLVRLIFISPTGQLQSPESSCLGNSEILTNAAPSEITTRVSVLWCGSGIIYI